MTFVRVVRYASLPIGVGVLAGVLGCGGGSKADVSGTIQLRGQPPKMSGLQIVFMESGGATYSAPIKEDGSYKAEGLQPGEMKICFTYISPDAVGAESKPGSRLAKPGPNPEQPTPRPSGSKETIRNPIAAGLRDTSTSKLTFKVESGKANVFDFNLP